MSKCSSWADDPILKAYHDHEWCKIKHDDNFQFEMLCLEGASTGLSWKTIIHRRSAYRAAFHDFNIDECAAMSDSELESQLNNPDLIRNRNKIFSIRTNARVIKKIQEEFGSFDSYLWSFTDGKQIIGNWETLYDVPIETELSQRISKDMKKRGIKFVGSVITYSFMQSIGIVNDHLYDCEYR